MSSYGLFYVRKNNFTHVLFVFKTRKMIESSTTKIYDINAVKNMKPQILDKIRTALADHFSQPCELYFCAIKNDTDLKKMMRDLRIDSKNIENPIVKLTELNNDIENVLGMASAH